MSSTEQAIAEMYFELSNQSDFERIAQLFDENTTYCSANTGLYLGVSSILEMQRAFHGSFTSLNWKINSVEEPKPGIVLFDYTFTASKPDGTSTTSDGLEYVVVRDGLIRHIDIRNK